MHAGVLRDDVAGFAGPYFLDGVAGVVAAGAVRDGPPGGVTGDVGVQAGQGGGQQGGRAVPGTHGGDDLGAQRGGADPAGRDVQGGGAVRAEQPQPVLPGDGVEDLGVGAARVRGPAGGAGAQHGDLQFKENQFDGPAVAVEGGDVTGGIVTGVQQRGHQREVLADVHGHHARRRGLAGDGHGGAGLRQASSG